MVKIKTNSLPLLTLDVAQFGRTHTPNTNRVTLYAYVNPIDGGGFIFSRSSNGWVYPLYYMDKSPCHKPIAEIVVTQPSIMIGTPQDVAFEVKAAVLDEHLETLVKLAKSAGHNPFELNESGEKVFY